jgi:hypothetical protein
VTAVVRAHLSAGGICSSPGQCAGRTRPDGECRIPNMPTHRQRTSSQIASSARRPSLGRRDLENRNN